MPTKKKAATKPAVDWKAIATRLADDLGVSPDRRDGRRALVKRYGWPAE